MYFVKLTKGTKTINHLYFIEVLTTNMLIELGEKVFDTVVIDYTSTNKYIKCITQNVEDFSIEVDYIHDFTLAGEDNTIHGLMNTLGMETLDEVLNYLVKTHSF